MFSSRVDESIRRFTPLYFEGWSVSHIAVSERVAVVELERESVELGLEGSEPELELELEPVGMSPSEPIVQPSEQPSMLVVDFDPSIRMLERLSGMPPDIPFGHHSCMLARRPFWPDRMGRPPVFLFLAHPTSSEGLEHSFSIAPEEFPVNTAAEVGPSHCPTSVRGGIAPSVSLEQRPEDSPLGRPGSHSSRSVDISVEGGCLPSLAWSVEAEIAEAEIAEEPSSEKNFLAQAISCSGLFLPFPRLP